MANIDLYKNRAWENANQLNLLRREPRVLTCCSMARKQIEIGDYDAGCAVFGPWWKLGEWPTQQGLEPVAAGRTPLIAGSLTDAVVRVKRMPGGQRLAEALIKRRNYLFDHLGENTRAMEARIELGCCYYHQGLFDIAHSTLNSCVEELRSENSELKAVALIRLAIVERHSGRLQEALSLLERVSSLEKITSTWTKGRFRTEMANTLKAFGVAEGKNRYFDYALNHYKEASLQFEQVGNLRYVAAVENNRGYLLLSLERFKESEIHLERARALFKDWETLSGVPKWTRHWPNSVLLRIGMILLSAPSSEPSTRLKGVVRTLFLAEALATQGLILCRLGHKQEAKPIIERARRVAERCGDREGAGRAC